MPGKDFGYTVIIEKGHKLANDAIIEFLIPRVEGNWLDVGCNTGWLLSCVPNGVGVDATRAMVQRAAAKRLRVCWAWGEALPFPDDCFDCVVLGSVLEQSSSPNSVLREALRVGGKVIGINPYPDSPWGEGSRSPWANSVIYPGKFGRRWNASVEHFDRYRWYFEIGG